VGGEGKKGRYKGGGEGRVASGRVDTAPDARQSRIGRGSRIKFSKDSETTHR
jgi:hypothetical protein